MYFFLTLSPRIAKNKNNSNKMRKWMTLLAACCAAGVQAKVTLPVVFTDKLPMEI